MDGRPIDILPQLTVLTFACINVIVGAYHGSLTKRMEREAAEYGVPKTKIKHGWWAAAYFGVVALLLCLSGWDWWLAAAGVTVRKPTFDISYNLSRFNKFGYISNEVKIITGLWDAIRRGKTIDWIHWVIFGRYQLIYHAIYAAATIYITFFKL